MKIITINTIITFLKQLFFICFSANKIEDQNKNDFLTTQENPRAFLER